MNWSWEYDPNEEHLIGGAPAALVAAVEKRADELALAAEALYLDGTTHQDASPKGENVLVPGGMFLCQIIPRHERVYIMQITCW
ncbi:hypothetical protein [Streptomyces sp. RKAG337]|uniref:hypothetical protein n=1 Tax=Streptomyces sp. RKAG337 TaxID=2893404 RepID=UPI0020349A8A|nr:hypothetical protein [Streptomyces sp. RKAG337]MCM2427634.1 hypothetical protein [Streptomyces sp. RKAG337]